MKNFTFRITEIQRVKLAAHAKSRGISISHMARVILDFYFNEFNKKINKNNDSFTEQNKQIESLQNFLGVLNKSIHELCISNRDNFTLLQGLIEKKHTTQMQVIVPGIKRISRAIVVISPEHENDLRTVFNDPVAFGGNHEK